MHRLLAAVLVAAPCAAYAQAQPAGPRLTLDQALSAAGAGAPSVEVAEAGVRAASAARTVAGLRPNPEVQVQVENVGGTGQYRGTQSAETTVGMALPIELGGKRSARIAVADSRSARARIEAAVAQADLREQVMLAFAEVVAADLRLDIAGQRASFAQAGHRAASVRVTAGSASPIEQRRAEVERLNAEVAWDQARRDTDLARSNLARYIGQPVAGALDTAWFDHIAVPGPRHEVAIGDPLEVAAATADVRTANAQVRVARASRVPDVTLTAGARRLSASTDTAAIFGVSIPLPLFNGGQAAVSQAEAELQQVRARQRMAELDTGKAIATARAELANAEANARASSGPALAAASEAARIARIGYAQGKFGQLDLLEAERTLAATRTAAVDALAAYHKAEARLERLLTPAPAPFFPGDFR
jgi:cobalt-zinc-cadmium efflux system outer membrane protein